MTRSQGASASNSGAGPKSAGRRVKNKKKSEFGGKGMPPEMLTWCKAQLMALTANDDTTLVHFVRLSVFVCLVVSP